MGIGKNLPNKIATYSKKLVVKHCFDKIFYKLDNKKVSKGGIIYKPWNFYNLSGLVP